MSDENLKDDDLVPKWTEPGPEWELNAYCGKTNANRHATIADLRKAAEAAGMRLTDSDSWHGDMAVRIVEQDNRIAELEAEVERLKAERDSLRSELDGALRAARQADAQREAFLAELRDVKRERDDLRRQLKEAGSVLREMRDALAQAGLLVEDSQSALDVVQRLTTALDEARQAQPSVVPVEVVQEAIGRLVAEPGWCHCSMDGDLHLRECRWGAARELLAALGQPGAVIVAESASDAEVLLEWQRLRCDTSRTANALRRAAIVERRHIDVLREAARYDSRSPTKLIIEALDATEAKS